MKKLNNNVIVDIDKELSLMIDYVLETWDGDRNYLTDIVTQSFYKGLEQAEFWVGDYAFSDFSSNWMNERETIGLDKGDLIVYDDIYRIPHRLMMSPSSFKQEILKNWDYSKFTEKLTRELKNNEFKVLPKGWQDVEKSGKDAFSYWDSFTLKTEKLFKGYDSDSAGSPGFHGRINLAHTYYGDKEQGRKPLYTLISSAVAHGLTIQEHNNVVAIQKEAQKLKNKFSTDEFKKITYLGDLKDLSDNKLFKALMVDKYGYKNKQEYHSQNELESYLQDLKDKREIYGLVEICFSGNDDYYYQGFKIQRIYSLEHFEQQIKENLNTWFEGKEYKDIYYSDNNSTPVTKDEILNSLSFKQLTKKEAETIKNSLNSLQYGTHEEFMDYKFPTNDEIIAMNADSMKKHMKALMSSIKTPSDETKQKEENRHKFYSDSVWSILKDTPKKQIKLK